MIEQNEDTPYKGAPYMGLDETDMGSHMALRGPEIDAIHEAFNSEDLDYVARRGFAVSTGKPMPNVPLPFITISGSRIAIRVREQMKDVFRGVQLHFSETESRYAELELGQPTDIVDTIIRYAEDAELAGYNGLTHTGPMPVYAMHMKEEQIEPILTELEQRMTAIKEEAARLTEKPPEE